MLGFLPHTNMAIIESAKKAIRSSARKRAFNVVRKDAISSFVKQYKKLVADKKTAEALAFFPKVQQAIDKAVKTNYIKRNTAARKKSRLLAMVKKATAKV